MEEEEEEEIKEEELVEEIKEEELVEQRVLLTGDGRDRRSHRVF